jgi:hypothetical protein
MPNMEVWTEEDLIKETAGRTGVNLPTWTEEELEEESKRKSGSGFSAPDWKPDEGLIKCPKCEYTCKPDWGSCPMCDTPLDTDSSVEEKEETKEEQEFTEEITEETAKPEKLKEETEE